MQSFDNGTTADDTDSMPTLDGNELQDDLQSIRGVGAKIEQKLNMLGITNFKGLVALDEDDYKRAAGLIPNLEGRMERDGWSAQARTLHREKYNEEI